MPKARATKSTLEYYRVLQEMCARLRDAHTNVSPPSQFYDDLYAHPQLRTRLIEVRVIVIGVSDALRADGIEIGQEVIEVNGLPVRQYAERKVMPYTSSSTPQDLDERLYEYYLFMGPAKEPVEPTLRDEQGRALKKTVRRLTREEARRVPPARRARAAGRRPAVRAEDARGRDRIRQAQHVRRREGGRDFCSRVRRDRRIEGTDHRRAR